jgi:hypothetical protein
MSLSNADSFDVIRGLGRTGNRNVLEVQTNPSVGIETWILSPKEKDNFRFKINANIGLK